MKSKPRVLLLSASSGAGHLRAAQALEQAFSARGDCIVEHVDAMKYASKLFQSLYHKTYISLANRAPDLLGLLYNRTDQPWNHPRPRLAVVRLNVQPMNRILNLDLPYIYIASHILSSQIIVTLFDNKSTRH